MLLLVTASLEQHVKHITLMYRIFVSPFRPFSEKFDKASNRCVGRLLCLSSGGDLGGEHIWSMSLRNIIRGIDYSDELR